MKDQIVTSTPTRTRTAPATSALPKVSGQREALPTSFAEAPPTAASLLVALNEALPNRFRSDFQWSCGCSITGFPGCKLLSHFCQRVYLALLDYHQLEESISRNAVQKGDWCGDADQLLKPEGFSKKRSDLLDSEVLIALSILKKCGVHLK